MEFKIRKTHLLITICVITIGIWDLVMVLIGDNVEYTVSTILTNIGFDQPMIVFMVGFVCGHLFGYMKPVTIKE